MKLIRGIIALVTGYGVLYGTWQIYNGSIGPGGFEFAALGFGALAVGRATLMAWLRRNEDVYGVFKNKATGFVKTPLQEFAFVVPIYAAPAIWTQYGLWTVVAVPVGWVVMRGLVRFLLEGPNG